MIKTLLIDDEPSCLSVLRAHFKTQARYGIVGCATTLAQAVELTERERPELVFLDIALGGDSGFDYLERFKDAGFFVVITTAHLRHSLRAIQMSAPGFLLKPFAREDFEQVIHKFENAPGTHNQQHIQALLNNRKHPDRMKVSILVKEGLIFIDAKDIVRCEASESYTEIYLDLHTKHLVTNPLKAYEEQLGPSGFFRVHRSHLVNLSKVQKYLNAGRVVMEDGSEVEVSSRKKTEFLKQLGDF